MNGRAIAGGRRRAAGLVALVTATMLPVAACSLAGSAPQAHSSAQAPAGSDENARPQEGAAGGQTAADETPSRLPSAAQLSAARADVAKLSTRRLAAQLVVPRQSGSASAAATALQQQGYGGYAVFRDNLPAGSAAVPAAKAANQGFTRAVEASGRTWPAFISIDQEGGPVTRLDAPLTMFPAAMALGAADDQGLARTVGAASGAELRGLGYTVVLAPDVDVTIGAQDPTIGVRSPSSDPQRVARVGAGLTAGYLDAGIVPTLKHFPGHGSVTADTHVGTVVQPASLAALRQRDLVPFAQLKGAPAIMTAHIVVPALDRDRPATVSHKVLTGLLREELRFGGLIVTDALEMAAVSGRFGAGKAAVEAVRAGADVLLMPADPAAAVDALVAAVDDGTLTRARLEESATRMVATLRAGVHAAPEPSAPGSHQQVAKQLAAASITQISGQCGGKLVGSGISISGGSEVDRAALTRAAQAAGLRTGSGTTVALRGGSTYRAAENAGEAGGGRLTADIVVALDAPYALANDRARVAKLATFGRTPATFAGLVDVLLGRQAAAGTLPVAVGDHAIGSGCGREQ
ncbi:beta-N-acetylhexosaminidase [Kineosphaera limosa]|uniref:beta-N-acetylhexosaminidase n=1 Tax=Kineosphaera limosa NBRC 100340 TaxID=1184609 RepID=K6VD24_9MICO|nr:glycoside hydrolase family 3 N-terminal domain-containing protein [Kineosphaera limosa]NYE02258.1 beta-N-acetylhexosaminidase [Kineosphaera limosa]GAB94113.1 beta-hexosaminidase [Kineosphaera limosa NBRC 100340]